METDKRSRGVRVVVRRCGFCTSTSADVVSCFMLSDLWELVAEDLRESMEALLSESVVGVPVAVMGDGSTEVESISAVHEGA